MPQALPYIALAGAGITAAGSISSGIAQGQAAHYRSQVAANNAIIAQQNATRAASAGAAQTEQAGMRARQRLALTRAGIAANGLDVNSGTPADVQTGQRQIGALDTATVANNAAQSVYGYESQATGYQAQSGLDEAQAGYDPIAGGLKAAGTLASDAPNFSSLLSGTPAPPASSPNAWMFSPSNSTNPEDIW